MLDDLKVLDYKDIFKYFTDISMIPRGSGNEKEVSDYIVCFAKDRKLEHYQDKAGNVIIVKEASKGYEDEDGIVLQAHMDMVCEKKSDKSHDFLKDPIELIVCEDFLCAVDTTLGADNGIGVAYILAILADNTINHPRLEAIITTDEEVGMNGAKALDLSKIKGKYMINLDSEEEGHMLISCAGGLTGTGIIPISRVLEYGKKVRIKIKGLKGGHSGSEIHRNRSNGTKLLARLLFDLREKDIFSLIDMHGGFKDNVIPREAEAEIFLPITHENSSKEEALSEAYKKLHEDAKILMDIYKNELISSEPDLDFEIEDLSNDDYKPLDVKSFEKVLYHLVNIPYGVQVMSSNMKGLVESSLNLGIFKIHEDEAEFCSSIRSSIGSYKEFLSNKLEYLTSFIGGEYFVRNEYPAWEYNPNSKLREHVKRIYYRENDTDMKVEAIHAGLECGLIGEKKPDLDMISIGPDMYDVHTVDERVSISSTIRVYKFLEKVVEEKIV